jgi:hypothetical protein
MLRVGQFGPAPFSRDKTFSTPLIRPTEMAKAKTVRNEKSGVSTMGLPWSAPGKSSIGFPAFAPEFR